MAAGGEVDLGAAVLRLYGDRSELDKELEKLRRYTEQLEKQGIKVKFDAETGNATREVNTLQQKLVGLRSTLEAVSRGMEGDASAWESLADMLTKAGKSADGGSGGISKMAGGLASLSRAAGVALPILGQIGLAGMGLQTIFNAVAAAVGSITGPLQALSQQTGEFNKQVAEASIFTSQAFAVIGPDGKAIEGTSNQMRALRGRITGEFKEIQKEVAMISGATSSQVYDAFNIISQNNSGLGKQGENLSNVTKLSTRIAAAMATLNIPGYQLRGEASSLLSGNVQPGDELAMKLYGQGAGERIRTLQAEGKYYDDLMDKLNKLYDGQKVLAASLENTLSNFQDVMQSINTSGGQGFERGSARALQAILTPLTELKDSFGDMMRSIGEGLEPVIVLAGQLAGALVPVLSVGASIIQIISDITALVGNFAGAILTPIIQFVTAGLTTIAKTFQLLASLVSTMLRPITLFFRLIGQQGGDYSDNAFDKINDTLDSLIAKSDRLGAVISKPFIEAAKAAAWLEGKARGLSDKEIMARQADIAAEFADKIGTNDKISLRSINVSPLAKQMQQEAEKRYAGAIPEEKQLAKTRELADIKEKIYNNEITALNQGLALLQAQRAVQEKLFGLADARRGLETQRAQFQVSVAASPEARAQAEDRRNQLANTQEQQRIRERVTALQSEKAIQQQQLEISIRQAAIQQQQLTIQRAEIDVQRLKTRLAMEEFYQKAQNAAPNSAEQKSLLANYQVQKDILNIYRQQLEAADRAVALSAEGATNLRRTGALQQQSLDIQQRALGVQVEAANLSLAQQRVLTRLNEQEQAIKNNLAERTQVETRLQNGRQQEIAILERQRNAQEKLQAIEKSRTDLTKARLDANAQDAERMLSLARAQADARNNPTSVSAVIGAQIEALALGRTGLVSEADAVRELYNAKARQLNLEQSVARQQLEFQQKREASEQRIALLRLQVERTSQNIAILNLEAAKEQLKNQAQRDTLSGATGAAAPPVVATGGRMISGARTNRTRDPDAEATGWDIVVPGGRGGAVTNPFGKLTITGTGFQGRGAGSTGKGYGSWVSGEFNIGGKKYEMLLGHFDSIDVAKGMTLGPGDRIGSQGITGRTFGTHVTTHVNPKGGASTADAWQALEALTRAWETGRMVPGSGSAALPAMASRPRSGPDIFAGIDMNGPIPDATPAPLRRLPGGSAPMLAAQPLEKPLNSLGNSLQANTDSMEQTRQLLANIDTAIKDLQEELGGTRTRNEFDTEALRINQAEQSRAMEVERMGAQLKAEILNSPRGRLAAGLTEDTVGGLGGGVRQALSTAMQGGDIRGAIAQALAGTADRLAQTTLNSILAPLEQLLTGNLFQALSGFSGAAGQQMTAAQLMLRAGQLMAQSGVGSGFTPGGGGGLGLIGDLFGGLGPGAGLVGAGIKGLGSAFNVTDFPMAQFAAGGVSHGPKSGYAAMLHGTEAIVPLPNGRSLPVQLQGGAAGGGWGGGSITIPISVDATGTAVAGNNEKGSRLGEMVGQAVKEVLIREKRPGGILYN